MPHRKPSVRVMGANTMPYIAALVALPTEVHALIDPQDPALDFIVDALDAMRCVGCDMSDPVTLGIAVDAGHRKAAEFAAMLESGEFEREQRWQAEVEAALARSGPFVDPRPDRSQVYYMRLGNRCKIGFSADIRQRMMVIMPEELLATEPGGRTLEIQRHEQFKALRVVGEWFRYEGALVEHVVSLRGTP